jgi:hypothetical protein
MQKHYINVAERVQLAAAVAAESDEGKRHFRATAVADSVRRGRFKNVRQQYINETDTSGACFTSAASRLVTQAQAVFFDFEKLFVEREDFRRTSRSRGGQLILGVRQDLFQMTGHYSSNTRFALAICK